MTIDTGRVCYLQGSRSPVDGHADGRTGGRVTVLTASQRTAADEDEAVVLGAVKAGEEGHQRLAGGRPVALVVADLLVEKAVRRVSRARALRPTEQHHLAPRGG